LQSIKFQISMSVNYKLPEIIKFLEKVRKNNNREWFAKHKDEYLANHEMMIDFADNVLLGMQNLDDIETVSGKKSLYRIYRDVRFSKNKIPYNTHFGGGLKRATQNLRGGYYYHIEKGNSFVAGGFWGPNAADIKHIRQQISADPEGLEKVLHKKSIKETFGGLVGNQLKTVPRGFDIEDQAIELLRYKQLILTKRFDDKEILNANFHTEVVKTFGKMRPFLDYMSDILTTNLNGEMIH